MKIKEWPYLTQNNDLIGNGVALCEEILKLSPNSEVILVGGCVRDILLDQPLHDVDIATNVSIELIEKNFSTIDIGKNKDFGIVVVEYGDYRFEVAHYRSDSAYSDNRHPDSIKLALNFQQDAARRDFTVNAMGIDPIDGTVIDHHGGLSDLEREIIKAVGNPVERFNEDALRILRCGRFASRLRFYIEPFTYEDMRKCAHLVDNLSKERVQEEFLKAATSGPGLAMFINILDNVGVLKRILPELIALKDKPHSPEHHPEGDCWAHTLSAITHSRSIDPVTNLAVAFHDIGKGVTYVNREGRHTFYGHESQGARIIRDQIGPRLKFSGDVIESLAFAAEKHMIIHKIKELKRSTLAKLINDKNWAIAKDVAFADEAGRLSAGNVDEFDIKMENAEAIVKDLSAGGGPDGLRLKLREKINGEKLIEWIPDLNKPENKKFIGSSLRAIQDWIINSNRFDATEEELKKLAVDSFTNRLSK